MKRWSIKILCVFGALLLPLISFAQLVPCDTNCSLIALAALINNIVDFFVINVAVPLGVLMFAVGGFIMMFAPASEGNLKRGKDIMWNTFLGMAVVFTAWLIVKFVLVAMGFNAGFTWV
jgi:uncharacterized membrane-anchored protein